MSEQASKPTRHLLGLSGGKDSSALAIYIRDKYPEIHEQMEYFFADTGAELPETLEFVDILQDYLGKPIIRLNPEKDFAYYLKLNGNFLPTLKTRWCTVNLKIKPFEEYVGNETSISYVGIRADELSRQGYISKKPNITARYPFIEDGLKKEDILSILEKSGLGIPKYYEWRNRSGCFFCFFQQKIEWVGLAERYPDLFQQAMAYESFHQEHGRDQTWSQGERLEDLLKRIDIIKENNRKQLEAKPIKKHLIDQFSGDDGDDMCLICHL